jgi:acetyl-CoA C-acetyltransferase
MKAVMVGFDSLHAEPGRVIVGGGMESISNAPFLLPNARSGVRLGNAKVTGQMTLDGLEDAYDRGRLMGTYAEDTAVHFGFSRDDAFAVESLTRAMLASECAYFENEIVSVEVPGPRGPVIVFHNEQPQTASVARFQP